MNAVQYSMLANVYIAVFLGFYVLFLKKETFFQLNRVYLLGALLLSFIMPVIQANWLQQLSITRELKTIYLKPVTVLANPVASAQQWTGMQIISGLYILGVAIFALHLLIRLMAVKRFISDEQSVASWSFFRKIHLGGTPNQLIGEHEKVHAEQLHSVDVLLIEIVVILNWFNPVAYIFRKELKNVHEFIADEGALRAARSKKEYAMLLLSQTFDTPINNLVNTFFNENLLKQRIMMIQKNRSRKRSLIKYSLSAPLLALMLLLSSATTGGTADNLPANKQTQSKQKGDDKLFTVVEHPPTFPGGLNKFYDFLGRNIRYPAQMKAKGVEGKVFLNFIVEANGSLSNIKVLREPGYGSGKEAARVLALSPKWKPGVQNGQKVRVSYNVPISFSLADKK